MSVTRLHRSRTHVRVQHAESPQCRAIVRPMLLVLLFAAAIASCDGTGSAWATTPAAGVRATTH